MAMKPMRLHQGASPEVIAVVHEREGTFAVSAEGVRRKFRLAKFFFVTFSLRKGDVVCLVAEWDPSVPKRLHKRHLEAFLRGRDQFIAEMAASSAIPSGVIALDPMPSA